MGCVAALGISGSKEVEKDRLSMMDVECVNDGFPLSFFAASALSDSCHTWEERCDPHVTPIRRKEY